MIHPNGKDRIHVAFAADANYAVPLAVAICSIAMNCNSKRGLVFHVIQSAIGQELREKIERSLAQTGFRDARINWLDAPLERLAEFDLAHPWTTSLTFARLLTPELLPAEVERALYLDCDIVVNDDVSELWDMDFGEKFVFAVRDEVANVGQPKGLVNHRELGIPADAHYFNAGVLLMNLRKWRQHNTSEEVRDYLRTYRAIIQLADQEALNAILWRDWIELDYRWNWQIPWRKYRLGKATWNWKPATTRKSIIHFACSEKPWLPGCDYEEKRYFFEYLDQTEWAGWRVPFLKEISGRSARTFQETRDALGKLRRRIFITPRNQ
jgi:lipopolysaccharide biosynthesis glycosyltransferase